MSGSPQPLAYRRRPSSLNTPTAGALAEAAAARSGGDRPGPLTILTQLPGSTGPELVASPADLRQGSADPEGGGGRRSDEVFDDDEHIPELVSLAPTIFVPATFDYTKPQPATEAGNPVEQKLAAFDAHATAVKANISWMVRREARRIHRDTVAQETWARERFREFQQQQQYGMHRQHSASAATTPVSATTPVGQQQGQHPPAPRDPLRSRRLSPTPAEDDAVLRNLRGPSAGAGASSSSSGSSGQAGAGGVSQHFSWHNVPKRPVDVRDTPREAAVTRLLDLARFGEEQLDIYEAHARNVRARRRESAVHEMAGEMAQMEGVRMAREAAAAARDEGDEGDEGDRMVLD